jgi:predicted glutamate--cysteine ligase
MTKLLKKGLEIELFGGTKAGEVLPLSEILNKNFSEISQEPDQRNFEYITKVVTEYDELFSEIIIPRMKYRNFLKKNGDLILIPGSTIPLNIEKKIYRSNPSDPYHEYIEKSYQTKIITTSLHINIGIENSENLFKLLCALRLDMPLILALSASSCFYDGKLTDYNSYRWHSFPKTPSFVPFFIDHKTFIEWTNEQLQNKSMQNIRHLLTSIRPNGTNRPYDLNRIEIRISDFVSDVRRCVSIVAFIECLAQNYLLNNNWPKVLDKNKSSLDKLVHLLDLQEEITAKDGLNAIIWDWRNDTEEKAYKIIESLYKDLTITANKLNMDNNIKPLTEITTEGNEATNFIKMYNKNKSIEKTIQYFIQEYEANDLKSYNLIKNKINI